MIGDHHTAPTSHKHAHGSTCSRSSSCAPPSSPSPSAAPTPSRPPARSSSFASVSRRGSLSTPRSDAPAPPICNLPLSELLCVVLRTGRHINRLRPNPPPTHTLLLITTRLRIRSFAYACNFNQFPPLSRTPPGPNHSYNRPFALAPTAHQLPSPHLFRFPDAHNNSRTRVRRSTTSVLLTSRRPSSVLPSSMRSSPLRARTWSTASPGR